MSNKKPFVHKKISYDSKNLRAVTEFFFNVQVGQSFSEAIIKRDMHKKRPAILWELSFNFAIKFMASDHVLLIMRIIIDENKHGRQCV